MPRTPRLLAFAVLSAALASGCSENQPAKSFTKFPDGQRVVAAYGRTANLDKTVSIEPSTRTFVLRMDCIADGGLIKIGLDGGFVGVKCRKKSNRAGYIAIGVPPGESAAAKLTVAVKAPEGSKWSIAVDTDTHEVSDLSPEPKSGKRP